MKAAFPTGNKALTGMLLAVLATLIWSGNFIVARGVAQEIPPVSLAFYRWATATLLLAPLAGRQLRQALPVIRQNKAYLFWTALSGVTLFNTFVYVAGHYSEAINLALIGTTTSPVFSILLARLFLREYITPLRLAGLSLCIAGILLLLSNGSWSTLLHLRFGKGDWWILAAALAFAVYNIFVRRKPASLPPLAFLLAVFATGTLLLLPAWVVELQYQPAVQWNLRLLLVVLYLGAGTSVIAFLCWNAAISRLGAGRTALFGNLIPLFSTLEAVVLLGERVTWLHAAAGAVILSGLVLANRKALK
ncbi:MAG TPA: DMT family transporter [Lacibacter sp.]|nr:DMT family transporter [Lacibacter sp.]HMO89707.1 DMT family transporter [Lacibacter sp.]